MTESYNGPEQLTSVFDLQCCVSTLIANIMQWNGNGIKATGIYPRIHQLFYLASIVGVGWGWRMRVACNPISNNNHIYTTGIQIHTICPIDHKWQYLHDYCRAVSYPAGQINIDATKSESMYYIILLDGTHCYHKHIFHWYLFFKSVT